jgi:hypothetical protein
MLQKYYFTQIQKFNEGIQYFTPRIQNDLDKTGQMNTTKRELIS